MRVVGVPINDTSEHGGDSFTAKLVKRFVEGFAIVIWLDGSGAGGNDIACVEFLIHFNQGDTGGFFVQENSPFGRVCSSEFGQEGKVEIERVGKRSKPGGGNEFAVAGGKQAGQFAAWQQKRLEESAGIMRKQVFWGKDR